MTVKPHRDDMPDKVRREDALPTTDVPGTLEYVPTSALANEIIRRCDQCIVVMLRPSSPEDGRGSLSFFSSYDFDRLSHMCAVTHAHLWALAKGPPPRGA
jgi:hypothetical protein